MILVEQTAKQMGEGPGPVAGSFVGWQHDSDRAWVDDVALEMWIDVTKLPVAVRLAGLLDASTGANLLGVVKDCMAEGQLDFDFEISALEVDGSGWSLVDRIREPSRKLADGSPLPRAILCEGPFELPFSTFSASGQCSRATEDRDAHR